VPASTSAKASLSDTFTDSPPRPAAVRPVLDALEPFEACETEPAPAWPRSENGFIDSFPE
jgi:hypothetical protein